MANTISDKLTYLEGTKSAIKDAIVAKGVAVSDSDTFRSYADKIGQISGGGGKVNLNDYGLTLSHSVMSTEQFDNIEWTLDKEGFCSKFNYPGYINMSDHTVPNQNYEIGQLFDEATIHQLDMSPFRCGYNASYCFRYANIPNANIDLEFYTGAEIQGICVSSNVDINSITVYASSDSLSFSGQEAFNYFSGNKLPVIKIVSDHQVVLNMYCPNFFCNLPLNITTIPELDFSNTVNQDFNNFFGYEWNSPMTEVTTIEGIINLRANVDFRLFPSLTSESIDNILNKAADLTTEASNTITFAADVYNALTEEQKSLAASKNWALASA